MEDKNVEGYNLMREVCLLNSYINASGNSSHKTFAIDSQGHFSEFSWESWVPGKVLRDRKCCL